jgi:hypothetical protein
MFQGVIGIRWNAFRAFIIKQITMSNASMVSTTSSQDLLTTTSTIYLILLTNVAGDTILKFVEEIDLNATT